MCSATILPRDIVMIADLVTVVGVEGLVAYGALDFLDDLVGEPIVTLEKLLVVVEAHRLCLEAPQLTNDPLHTIITHP